MITRIFGHAAGMCFVVGFSVMWWVPGGSPNAYYLNGLIGTGIVLAVAAAMHYLFSEEW